MVFVPELHAAHAVESLTGGAVDAAKNTGRSLGESWDTLWARLEETRLRDRTPEEIAAWVMMGMMVGALAGMFTALNSTIWGRGARLCLGLAGALIGGLAAHVGGIDFGWAPIVIRPEALVLSFAGAVGILVLIRVFRGGWRGFVGMFTKPPPPPPPAPPPKPKPSDADPAAAPKKSK
jgi:uncharacterized membrane protein YeaQ/YmgE (transglycosylase-associated protein family)